MKYKVTTRGWIVFSLLGILLIYGLISIGSSMLNTSDESVGNDYDQSLENENDDLVEDQVLDNDSEDATGNNDHGETSDDQSVATETTPDDDSSVSDDSTNEEEDTNEVSQSTDEVDITQELEVIFDKNVHLLKPEYHEVLNQWAALLKSHEDLLLKVEGHINGYPYYNDGTYGLNIAENRAEIVKAYMIAQGIDADRIETINMGSRDQAVKTDNVSEHYRNRRAVLYLDKK